MNEFKLSKSFVDNYRGIPVPFGYGLLSELTYYRTYSRSDNPNTPTGKENWVDTCERVINGMFEVQRRYTPKVKWDNNHKHALAKEAFDGLFNLRWSPSGRGLWALGSDFVMKKNIPEALSNCFSGNELLITKEFGVISFEEIENKNVLVWTKKGWKKATIKNFGFQSVQRVSFSPAYGSLRNGVHRGRSKISFSVTVTPDHRWILGDGRETTALSVGDVVKSECVSSEKKDQNYRNGFVHGFIFGDGSKISHEYANGDFGFRLRVCGNKINILKEYIDLFDKTDLVVDNDPIFMKRSSMNLKDFPEFTNHHYLKGFLDGWMDADASYTPSGSRALATINNNALSWLTKNAAICGYLLTGHSIDNRETNFGKRTSPLHKFILNPSKNVYWKVSSIDHLDEKQSVYCAVVPDVGSFTLASGIYTGNCAFISTQNIFHDRDIFEWTMNKLMLGVGVGFDTRGKDILKIHSPRFETVEIVIDDTREGWATSTQKLIDSYLFPNQFSLIFDYNKLRPRGALIKGFGGISSGPQPLIRLHETIRKILSENIGEFLSSRLIVDLFNIIGVCVVSGNVRRSSEIALGDPDDQPFLNLKNYSLYPERMEWGYSSNNSIFAKRGMDYTNFVDRIYDNGEPGLFWLENAQQYGRMREGGEKYDNAIGGNPCLEIPLFHKELCVLSDIYLPRQKNTFEYARSAFFAHLCARSVTLLSDEIEDDDSRDIMEHNRRTGVSNSGVSQFMDVHGRRKLKVWLNIAHSAIMSYDLAFSEEFNMPRSIRSTTGKPGGTTALLAGVTPGIHFSPTSRFFLRRVTLDKDSHLVPILEKTGVNIAESERDPSVVFGEFPIDAGKGVRGESEVTVYEQANLIAMYQREYCDNATSATIKFDRDIFSKDDMRRLIEYLEVRLKGISFLPLFDHGYSQPPYEPLTQEQFVSLSKGTKSTIHETMSITHDMEEKYCDGEMCAV